MYNSYDLDNSTIFSCTFYLHEYALLSLGNITRAYDKIMAFSREQDFIQSSFSNNYDKL